MNEPVIARHAHLRAPARRAGLGLLLAALCGSALAQASASWNTLGPAGGGVSALVASPLSPATLYAGTPENGVFVSSDGGQTWSAANSGLPASTATGRQALTTIHAMVADPRYVIVATDSGLYYTAAGAAPQWTAMATTGCATPVTMLAFEASTRRLFAAGSATPSGVCVTSLDTSAAPPAPAWSFQALPPASSAVAVSSLALVAPTPGNATPGVLAAAGNALYAAPLQPASLALSWHNADPQGVLAADVISALLFSADYVQAYACSGGSVFVTGNPLDVQPVWLQASVPAPSAGVFACSGFAAVPAVPGGAPYVLLGTDQGAYVSLDGTSFVATAAMDVSPAANAFASAAAWGTTPATVFAGGGFGVSSVAVASLAPNSAWNASNGPASVAGGSNGRLNNANIVDSAVVGSTLYAAAVSTGVAEVFASADGGASWSATRIGGVLNASEEIGVLVPDAAHTTLYAGTTQGLLAYSTSASQWAQVPAFTAGRVSALALGSSALFAGSDNGLYAVPLGSAPASAVPVAAGLAGMAVKALLVDGGNVFAAVIDANGDSVVYVASEPTVAAGTATWSRYGSNTLGIERVTGMVRVGTNLLASTNGNLVLFAAVGSAWTSANTSSDPAQQIADTFGVVTSLYTDGHLVYAATATRGVFVSPVGTTFAWTSFNGSGDTALPSLEVHSLRLSGTTLYAATRAGIASAGGATATGPTPSTPTPTTSTPAASGGGGGAMDLRFGALLVLAVLALRRVRDRRQA